jgi:hypothetical protein
MEQEEILQLVENCLKELSLRFLIHLNSFVVRTVDRNGIHLVNFNLKAAA